MSRGKSKSFGLDTIISGVIKGLGETVIDELSRYDNECKSRVHRDVSVIDMKKDDEGCWRIIENE